MILAYFDNVSNVSGLTASEKKKMGMIFILKGNASHLVNSEGHSCAKYSDVELLLRRRYNFNDQRSLILAKWQ